MADSVKSIVRLAYISFVSQIAQEVLPLHSQIQGSWTYCPMQMKAFFQEFKGQFKPLDPQSINISHNKSNQNFYQLSTFQ